MPLITTTDLPYRSKFGNDRVDSTPRRWAGALVQYNEWHSSEKEAWADLSCDQVNLVVILGRHGGTCGPRFSLKKPMLADRNDPGFFFWIPANLTVYGFSQEARMIRELQVRFDAERLMPIWVTRSSAGSCTCRHHRYMTIALRSAPQCLLIVALTGKTKIAFSASV